MSLLQNLPSGRFLLLSSRRLKSRQIFDITGPSQAGWQAVRQRRGNVCTIHNCFLCYILALKTTFVYSPNKATLPNITMFGL